MAQQRLAPHASPDVESRKQLADEFMAALDGLAAEVAKLSPEDRDRFERELNEAIDSAVRRRVEYLDREAARNAVE